MRLQVKRLDAGLPLPAYQTVGASGLDLHAAVAVTINPGATVIIPTGIAVGLPPGHEGQVRPRSGWSSRGLLVSVGTIDADYTGAIGIIATNTTGTEFRIPRGSRIAQLVVAPVARCEVVEVAELGATERGDRGFGSTGGWGPCEIKRRAGGRLAVRCCSGGARGPSCDACEISPVGWDANGSEAA